MLTESGTLDRIADALDALPLTLHERAHIFHAIDTAPMADPWRFAKGIDLSKGRLLKPLTLAEAVRGETVPSASQILAGLHYAAGMLATPSEGSEA